MPSVVLISLGEMFLGPQGIVPNTEDMQKQKPSPCLRSACAWYDMSME